MDNIETKEKLEREKQVIFVCEINYLGKKYVKTIKSLKDGIKYIFYEIENENIKEIEDKRTLEYLKENYTEKDTDILY